MRRRDCRSARSRILPSLDSPGVWGPRENRLESTAGNEAASQPRHWSCNAKGIALAGGGPDAVRQPTGRGRRTFAGIWNL